MFIILNKCYLKNGLNLDIADQDQMAPFKTYSVVYAKGQWELHRPILWNQTLDVHGGFTLIM